MFGAAKKHANRVGCLPAKFMFTVHIKSVLLPNDSPLIGSGTILSVCFERGGKISSTNNKSCDVSRRDPKGTLCIIDINEKVELIATLYKDPKTNLYQEKTSKLILRQLKKNSIFNLDAYKGLGLYTLQLNQFASEIGFNTIYVSPNLRLPLDLLPNSFLEVVVTTHILKSHSAYNDDTRSMMSSLSGASDVSCIGATFDKVVIEHKSSESGDKKTSGGAKKPKSRGKWSIESIQEENEEEVEDDVTSPSGGNGHNHHQHQHHAHITTGTATASAAAHTGTNTTSHSASFPDPPTPEGTSPPPEGDEVQVNKKLLSWNVVKGDSKKDRIKKKKANKEAFRIYNEEIEAKHAHIKALETELHEQAQRYKDQILALQVKVTTLEKLNQASQERERNARIVLTNAYDRADLKIAEQLAAQREENTTLIEEYGRVVAEMAHMNEEVAYYKAMAEAALKEKRDEQLATQNAATVAVKAQLRRSELELENEELVEEIIDMKVKFANVSFDLDQALKKHQITKKRLQFYAEQFASLEIKYSTGLEGNSGSSSTRDGLTPKSGTAEKVK